MAGQRLGWRRRLRLLPSQVRLRLGWAGRRRRLGWAHARMAGLQVRMAAQVEAGGTLVRMAAQAWMWEAWMREAAASERRRLCGTLGTRARRRLVWLGASRLTRALEGGRRTCSLRAVSVATNCMRYLFIARFTPDTATTLQTGGGGQKRNRRRRKRESVSI